MVHYQKNINTNNKSTVSAVSMQYQRKRILLYIIAGLSLSALISWALFDIPVAKWLHQHPIKWTNTWCALGIRQLGKAWGIIWLLLLWAAVTHRTRPVTTSILALLLSMTLVLPLKVITNRTRPARALIQNDTQNHNNTASAYSFPSGDTSTVFAVTGVLIYALNLRTWIICLSVSTLIGLMRIFILAHYVSDVCTGAAIGLLCAYLALVIDQNCKFDSSILDKKAKFLYMAVLILPILWLIEGTDPILYFMSTIGIIALAWAAAIISQKAIL